MTQYFDTKDDVEKVVLTFDFAAELAAGETLAGTPVVAVTVSRGTDFAPSNLLNGAGGFDASATQWLQPVQGGIPGVQYLFRCVCATTNPVKTLARAGILPVVIA